MVPFNLIWSQNDDRKSFTDFGFIKDLKLDSLLSLNAERRAGSKEMRLEDFFTSNVDTIHRRQDLFFNFLNDETLYNDILSVIVDVETIDELIKTKDNKFDVESGLYSIKEIELYIEVIEKLYNTLSVAETLCPALLEFKDRINSIFQDEGFNALKENEKGYAKKVRNIKSVTIGVNLDAQLLPQDAAVVSVNDERFVSGSILDKFLKVDFSKSPYQCITPLENFRKGNNEQMAAINRNFNLALNNVFSDCISSWKVYIRKYVSDEMFWLCGLIEEFKFIKASMKLLSWMKQKKLPLARVIFAEEDDIKDLYNPSFVMSGYSRLVKNQITFDKEGKIYILTGANQGGKSVFTAAVGFLYAMTYLGMPVTASEAQIVKIDNIFTHLCIDNDGTYGKGRFGKECIQIAEASKQITKDSLFLYDEAFSSTSSTEAVYISEELLSAYAEIGVKGIFATHLHDLCNKVSGLNSNENIKSKIDNICAVVNKETKERTYTIVKGFPDGKSFATDIAEKYGLTKENILKIGFKY